MTGLGDAIRAMKGKPPPKPLPVTTPSQPLAPDPKLASAFRKQVLDWIALNPQPSGGVEGYLRGSGLYKVCARREAIFTARPELFEEDTFSLGARLTVDVGSAMHDWWQNKYLGPAQLLYGLWACLRCQDVTHEGLMPEACPKCGVGRQAIKYEEYELHDDTLRYAGHPDGLLELGQPNRPLFELKSISNYGYEHLLEVDPEHKAQVHGYMALSGAREALVVYVNRAKLCEWSVRSGRFFAGKPNVKVFHVVFDSDYWAGYVDRIKDYWRARALMSRDGYVDMDDVATFARVCPKRSDPLAKKCPARTTCFRAEAP